MGITHFAILKALNQNIKFTIVEPNFILRNLLSKNINANFQKDDSQLDTSFDLTLITTPPFIHVELLKRCIARGDDKIFIEKPFGGFSNIQTEYIYENKQIYIGYVYRFNPCVEWIKSNIHPKDIVSIKGQFLSNTLTKKPEGWRNGKFSGVLNEMGSHVIDLIQYITNEHEFNVLSVSKESVISDNDDIVKAELITNNDISVLLDFNWVKKEIRKPIFGLEIIMKDGVCYVIDQQQIKIYDDKENLVNKISVTNINETVPFYLRGVDFTKQMDTLLKSGEKMTTIKESLAVNKLMNQIYNYENNTR